MNKYRCFRMALPAIVFFLLFQSLALPQKTYPYVGFPDDPLGARIYTLDNGMKVYLSVFDEEPRIQTFVAVRVGSKNDPAETTGLAHYFEHLMFKGTSTFGTIDYGQEKPLLDKIETLFEAYRLETDENMRRTIYRQIDSISYIASTFAIPNEYDRLMTAIGSTGTNAGTSNDFTMYMENIPSNRLEQWAMIQAERFSDPVLRLFHTELETVYEEKNMSLTNDNRLASEAMLQGLFPNHPYGQQTTLGEAEHLKNPSLINIKNFFKKYYVPNNMAVIMAGDFDPDEAIRIIDAHFGKLEPSALPEISLEDQPEIIAPIVKEVSGLQAENVQLGWRFEGAASDQTPYLNMISMILFNGRAGLIDVNLNKRMATLGATAFSRSMTDHSLLTLSGRNKSGQSLDEVRTLLLEQVDLLRKGEFPEWLMEAAINNLRLQEMRRAENSRSRAMAMMYSFMNGTPYEQTVKYIDRLGEISRDDLIAFANQHLRDDNYVVVYKRQKQADVEQVEKPQITPIHINREAESPLLTQIKSTEVPPLEPVFIDYEQDVSSSRITNQIELLYAHNKANPTFSLTYFWETGHYHNIYLPLAASYLNIIGTADMSAEDISNEFFKMACTFNIQVDNEETRITLSGLSENAEASLRLFEKLIWEAKPDETALKRLVENTKKSRDDSKANQASNFAALVQYALYGPDNPSKHILSNEKLDALTGRQLIETLQQLWGYERKVIYFGPEHLPDIGRQLAGIHRIPARLQAIPTENRFKPLDTTQNKVYFAHYDANQSYLQTISNGMVYNLEMIPLIAMYNGYFGGGMNAIVFQEMREKRGLAYTARSSYGAPSHPDEKYINTSYIVTQNDKVIDAFSAFNELFNNMPLSETSFKLAQDQLVSNIRTQRIRDTGIIWDYLNARKMGHPADIRKTLFSELPQLTLNDILGFNQEFIKDQPKTFVILGNENTIDFAEIESRFGPITKLTKEELFAF